MYVPELVADNKATLTAALTLLAVVGQGILAHMKGKRGKKLETIRGLNDVARGVTLSEIHSTLTAFTDEQRATNERLAHRQTGLYYIVTGADDERGTNGLRSQVKDLAVRVRELEGNKPRIVATS